MFLEDDLIEINLSEVLSSSISPFDIFVRLASGRYMKVVDKGFEVNEELFRSFGDSKYTQLYTYESSYYESDYDDFDEYDLAG